MAEALAVFGAVGIAANIIQLGDFCQRVLSRLKEFHSKLGEVPKAFRSVYSLLPLLLDALKRTKEAVDRGSLSDDTQKAVLPVIDACKTQVSCLDDILSKITPTLGDSVWKRGKKALASVNQERDVEEITKHIRDYVQVLSFHHTTEIARAQLVPQPDTKTLAQMYRWLSPPDPSLNYRKARKLRQESTGTWFLNSAQYAQWKTDRNSFLWLHGIPGCGKTILSSTIIEDVLRDCENDPQRYALFFCFDFNDTQKQKTAHMIRSIIFQLCSYSHLASTALASLYSSSMDGTTQPSEDELLEILHQTIPECSSLFIILDALDECTDRNELCQSLEEVILEWKFDNLHILVTSRREMDLEQSLGTMSGEEKTLCIQSALVDHDIRQYIRHRLQNDSNLKRWRTKPELNEEIEKVLMQKAGGMFQWVACQLDALGKCLTVHMLRRSLASLPLTLDATYDRILSNIEEEYYEDALHLLQWITASARPLQIEELAEVVAINREGPLFFDEEKVLLEPSDILTICSSLVTVVTEFDSDNSSPDSEVEEDDDTIPESGLGFSKEKSDDSKLNEFLESDHDDRRALEGSDHNDTELKDSPRGERARRSISRSTRSFVRLSHYSVQEYLTSERIQRARAARFSIQKINAHGVIAGDCLAYLCRFDQQTPIKKTSLEHSHLAGYAAEYCTLHALEAEEDENFVKRSLLKSFWLNDHVFKNWIQLRNPDGMLDRKEAPLYNAALAGLRHSARWLIREAGAPVDAQGGRYSTALQAASSRGHKEMVEELISAGANVNAPGNMGGALIIAALQGHEKVVQVLISSGADLNARGLYGSPLESAAAFGHEKVVQLLIDATTDANAQGMDLIEALKLAIRTNHERVMKLLIDSGADVSMLERLSSNPFVLAAKHGYEKPVQLLIDSGVDVNTQDENYGTALQAAAGTGRKNFVHLLINSGADVNAQGGLFGTASHAASIFGHEEVVQILIDSGAGVNARGGCFGLALASATGSGLGRVTQRLMDPESSELIGPVHQQFFHNWEGFYLANFQLLIKECLKFPVPGGYFMTPLQAAAVGGNEKVVRILIESGADVNAHEGCFGTALQAASKFGHAKVVQLLSDSGAGQSHVSAFQTTMRE